MDEPRPRPARASTWIGLFGAGKLARHQPCTKLVGRLHSTAK